MTILTQTTRRFITRSLIAAVLPFLLLAFLAQSLLPSGFMPSVNKDGVTQIVICYGAEQKTITIPNDQAPPSQKHEGQGAKSMCAYAVLASSVTLPAVPFVTLPTESTVISANDIQPDTLRSSHSILSFPPRGPPAVSQA